MSDQKAASFELTLLVPNLHWFADNLKRFCIFFLKCISSLFMCFTLKQVFTQLNLYVISLFDSVDSLMRLSTWTCNRYLRDGTDGDCKIHNVIIIDNER